MSCSLTPKTASANYPPAYYIILIEQREFAVRLRSSENKVMIDRLEKILKGELAVTDTDKLFNTHEIRELERYRNLGIKDDGVPQSVKNKKPYGIIPMQPHLRIKK